MDEIKLNQLAEKHNENYLKIANLSQRIEAEIGEIRRKYSKEAGELVNNAKQSKQELLDAAHAMPLAFWEKKKSRVTGVVMVGLRKGKGKIEWSSEDSAISILRHQLSKKEFESVTQTKTTIKKDVVKDLDGSLLARAGISIVDAQDQYFVKENADATKALENITALEVE